MMILRLKVSVDRSLFLLGKKVFHHPKFFSGSKKKQLRKIIFLKALGVSMFPNREKEISNTFKMGGKKFTGLIHMLPLGCPQKFDKKIENLFSGRKMESFSVK